MRYPGVVSASRRPALLASLLCLLLSGSVNAQDRAASHAQERATAQPGAAPTVSTSPTAAAGTAIVPPPAIPVEPVAAEPAAAVSVNDAAASAAKRAAAKGFSATPATPAAPEQPTPPQSPVAGAEPPPAGAQPLITEGVDVVPGSTATQPDSGSTEGERVEGAPVEALPVAEEPAAAGEKGAASEEKGAASEEKGAASGEEATPGLTLLGQTVPSGTSTRLAWTPTESASASVISVPTPVLVINGAEPGPTLCLTAAIHGDELTGVEIVRRVMFGINPKQLRGAVIGVPIVNLQGFRRNSRYLPDRRDLNRFFPGNTHGSLAARVAHSFFHEVAIHCDAIVDMHTGSFHRTNLPQVRADMNHAGVAELARNLGAIVVLQSRGNRGTLRRAAVEQGIPAVTLEAGEPMRLAEEQVAHGVQSVQTLLNGMNMYGRPSRWGKPEPIYYKSLWVRSNSGGILFSRVKLGDRVRRGELLGTVTDPITNARAELTSPIDGRVIGMALNQVVMPGFAAYHLGVQTTEEHAAEPVAGIPESDEPAEDDGEPGEADGEEVVVPDADSAPPQPEPAAKAVLIRELELDLPDPS